MTKQPNEEEKIKEAQKLLIAKQQEEDQKCLAELNAVLNKYNRALNPKVSIELVFKKVLNK